MVTLTPAVVKNGRRVNERKYYGSRSRFPQQDGKGQPFFAVLLCIALTSSTIGMMRKARKSEMRYAFASR